MARAAKVAPKASSSSRGPLSSEKIVDSDSEGDSDRLMRLFDESLAKGEKLQKKREAAARKAEKAKKAGDSTTPRTKTKTTSKAKTPVGMSETPIPRPGAKSTPIPLPGARSTPIPLPGASRSSETPIPLPGASRSTETPIRTKVSSSKKDEGKRKEPAKTAQASAWKPKAAPKVAPPPAKDDLSTTDSSSDSSDDEQPATNDARDQATAGASMPKPTNTTNETSTFDSSSSDSELEAPTNGVNGTMHSTSAGASDSDEDMADAPFPATPAIPIQPYQPPSGFLKIHESTPAPSVSHLSPSDLTTKQIFYISAPSTIPISTLTSLPLSQLSSKTAPTIEHDGTTYKLSRDTQDASNTQILIPEDSRTYKPLKSKLASVLSLQRHIHLPQTTLFGTKERVITSTVSAGRAQPKGLKMRFRPSGYSAEDAAEGLGWSDSEDEGAERTARGFVAPTPLPESVKKGKRKLDGVEGEGEAEASPKKKKAKKDKEGKDGEKKKKKKEKIGKV